jgi:fimbrial chaperone protein
MRGTGSALLALLLSVGAAHASSFNISPIRAELSGAHRTEVLTLRNAEDTPVVIEVHVVQWSQENGEEQVRDTRDVLVTPPVMQIPGNSEQIVRIALRRDADPSRELTYRVIFEEVPQAAAADFTGLRVALRLSIPIFVAPARAAAKSEMAWEARWLDDGDLEVAATNRGSGHLQIIDFDVDLAAAGVSLHGNTAKYVLPGSRMVWTLKPPGNADKQGSISIHGRSDQGEFSADVVTGGI